MADSTDDDVCVRSVTNDMAKGDSVPGAAEERANCIRAASIDLKTGRDVSSDDAATRLRLDRNEAPS